MRIGEFSIWTSAIEAESYGCTHHARLFGIVPGFYGVIDGEPLWVPRSDALNWLEDALSFLAAIINQSNGDEPVFSFKVLGPIRSGK